MRIAIVSTYFSDTHANNEYELCRGLAALGHDVTLFTSDLLPPRFYKNNRSHVQEKESVVKGFRVVRVQAMFEAAENPYVPKLRSRILQERFDVIHAQEYYNFNSWDAFLASRKSNTDFIFTQHRHYLPTEYWGILFSFCDRIISQRALGIIKGAAAITAISSAARNFLIENCRVAPDRIEIIPHGVSSDKYHPKVQGNLFREELGLADEPVILLVGRLTYDKGIDTALYMLKAVKETVPDVKLIIVGRGPNEAEFKEIARSLSIEDSVYFLTDYVENDKMPCIYASCDLFVLPTRKEILSIADLEAMSSGKPVVVSDIGGMSDAVQHGENGFLINPNDQNTFNNCVIKMLSDDGLRNRFGNRSREIIEKKFSWMTVAKRTANLYQKITR